MDSLSEIFRANRTIVLFVYGLTFFVMGLAVFLQSRRHSRLRLARDLRWLAAFGIAHGIHEWGMIFIPIQSTYVSQSVVDVLSSVQVALLAFSFACLLMFGAGTLSHRWPWLRGLVVAAAGIWLTSFAVSTYLQPNIHSWLTLSDIWSRYLLCLPGSILAAYGLFHQLREHVAPLAIGRIEGYLYAACATLLAYAFFGGVIVPPGDFFPANQLNYHVFDLTLGVPVQVFRTIIGLILSVTIIRALEVFEIELDRLIEHMEIERIQAAERERIGQEIHDGAIQGVYSASLILESISPLVTTDTEAARRLQQARQVLNAVNTDLRSYMVSLREVTPGDPLIPSLRQLIDNPRFKELLDVKLAVGVEPSLKPLQVYHTVAIVQECLSNCLRHARARCVQVSVGQQPGAVMVTVADDGGGFAPDTIRSGYGLRSIRDRARLIGGRVLIDSAPGKGTRISLLIPDENL